MMLNTETLTLAADKKYSDFASKIRGELQYKLAHHEISKDYSDKIDSIHRMSSAFKEITTDK